jgi:transcriptional regulator with XRE-family HTH domain
MPPRAKIRRPFAERLVQLRKSKGLSQYELADKAGVSQRVVAHYETVVTNPASATVLRLAKALDVSPDQMMGLKPIKSKDVVSRKTIKDAKKLEELSPQDRKTVMRMVESLNGRSKKKS